MMRSKRYFIPTSLCVALLAVLCACGPKQPEYGSQTIHDESFALGSEREPTARTLHAMGTVLAARGEDEQAQAAFARLIGQHPAYMPAYNDLAALHLRYDRYAEARAALNAGLSLQPDDHVLLNNMGLCDLLVGNFRAAVESFNRAADLAPKRPLYRGNWALAMGLMGELERAQMMYETFLSPDDARANVNVIKEAIASGRAQELAATRSTFSQPQ